MKIDPGKLERAIPGALLAIVLAGCAGSTGTAGNGAVANAAAEPPPARRNTQEQTIPAGYGTLKQDEFTVAFRSGPLLVKVTPLYENVIRTAAPDTYNRLHAIAENRRAEALKTGGPQATELFLVTLFSYEPDVNFQPENIQVVAQGRQIRPSAVLPLTSGWGRQRLTQQDPQSAVYAFSGNIDYELPITVRYGQEQNDAWTSIVQKLQIERAKILARTKS